MFPAKAYVARAGGGRYCLQSIAIIHCTRLAKVSEQQKAAIAPAIAAFP
jgi:hypothetical protein